MKYLDFRERYPRFYYHDYTITESPADVQISFDFEIEGLSHFNPAFVVDKPDPSFSVSSLQSFRNAAFHLGLIELISYWKLTCAPEVIIECGKLEEAQIRWWKKLYYNGLGEFFFRNGIEADPKTFMHITTTGEVPEGAADSRTFSGCLIPVGGGKDSFVTLDLLKGSQEDNLAFVINPIAAAVRAAHAAGYKGRRCVVAERTLDCRMLEFNKQGYLNGHTPFSALAAFASTLTALVYGKHYVVLSNEASANEPTVRGSTVNHQYSKTYSFEKDFQDYYQRWIGGDVFYFSLLRPLSELQIAGLFADLKPYHTIFRSCNAGQKTDSWCGHCAKCLFVAILLSAYLEDEELQNIFHADMLNDPGMAEFFAQLTGFLDNKPFECVGTREEVNTAVCMSIARHEKNDQPLPLLYAQYQKEAYYPVYRYRTVSWKAWNKENSLPESFTVLLKKRLQEKENA